MKFEHVVLQGIEIIEGSTRVTSAEIEETYKPTLRRLGHRVGMLEGLTGVRARHLFGAKESIVDIATAVAKKVLQTTGTSPQEIDLLINSSVCKDYIEPSVASGIHGQLKLPTTTLNFDLANACLGFLNAMEVASLMIETRQIKRALIVDAENARIPLEATVRRLQRNTTTEQEFREAFATLTLGSGAAAILLTHQDYLPPGVAAHYFRGGISDAATEHNHLCKGWPSEMKTDAIGLLKAGVALGKATFQRAQKELGWCKENIDYIIMHQVGEAHTRAMLDGVGLSRNKTYITYTEYGNMGPAAIPFTLKLADTRDNLKKGERIALMGIGSGLNCSMMELIW